MKFRRFFLLLLFLIMVICFFTKPTEQDFMTYIQPSIARTGIAPVVDFEDRFLYVKVNAIYIHTAGAAAQNGSPVASAAQEDYLGVFNKFWKINSTD